MPNDKLTIGDVEITSLSDGVLAFDLCNFFPDIAKEDWKGQEDHFSAEGGVSLSFGKLILPEFVVVVARSADYKRGWAWWQLEG